MTVVSTGGYAGVVTCLLDTASPLWTVVAPHGPARRAAAYRDPVRVGCVAGGILSRVVDWLVAVA